MVYVLLRCVVTEWVPSTETKSVGGETDRAENVHFLSLKPIYINPGY